MKLTTERCCVANDSMFLLPSSSVSPNAYCALLVENKMRASAKVIQPRSSGGNADKERASMASVVPSSFVASGGTGASAPNSIPIKLLIPIPEVSCRCGRSSHRSPIYRPRMHSSTDAILPSRSGVLCERIHLLVEPDILHAPAVEDAVDHDCQALHIRTLAGAAAAVENDRSHTVVDQLALDRP